MEPDGTFSPIVSQNVIYAEGGFVSNLTAANNVNFNEEWS